MDTSSVGDIGFLTVLGLFQAQRFWHLLVDVLPILSTMEGKTQLQCIVDLLLVISSIDEINTDLWLVCRAFYC